MDDLDQDSDKGSFLLLPAIGMVLIAAGIIIIVVAYYPEIIPYGLSRIEPKELSEFLTDYYNDYKPAEMPQPYMTLAGLASIGLGAWFMILEYREDKEEKKYTNEQKKG
jgi:hypothetical protein